MNEHRLARRVLQEAYKAHFSSQCIIQFRAVISREDANDEELQSAISALRGQGLLAGQGRRNPYVITASGVIHCENKGFVSKELCRRNMQERLEILDALIRWHDANQDLLIEPRNDHERELFSHRPGGPPKNIGVALQDLCEEMGQPQEQITPHIPILAELGYINYFGLEVYLPTNRGRLTNKFEHLRNPSIALSPKERQERGRVFQRLIAEIVEHQGYAPDESVRTSNEEMDVVFYHGTEPYLIECKWKKKPIGPSVIGELLRKLVKRALTTGIIISMSGFTGGVEKEILEISGQYRVLLFDGADVGSLLNGANSLDSLLSRKIRAWNTRRPQITSKLARKRQDG